MKFVDVKDKYLNSEKLNKQGHLMKVVHYGGASDVIVMWPCGETTRTNSGAYSKGVVYYPRHKEVWGVGYIGFGTFINKLGKSNASENRMKIPKIAQRHWLSMLNRVYNPNYLAETKNRNYLDCTVQESWHNFQNFCWWAINQNEFGIREDNGNYYSLDKDIVKDKNTVYGEDCCVFVPSVINKFFRVTEKGSYGSGVKPVYKDGLIIGFTATVSEFNKERYLGYFTSPDEAEAKYVHEKKLVGLRMAEKWQGKVDDRVIHRLLNFEVKELNN